MLRIVFAAVLQIERVGKLEGGTDCLGPGMKWRWRRMSVAKYIMWSWQTCDGGCGDRVSSVAPDGWYCKWSGRLENQVMRALWRLARVPSAARAALLVFARTE